MAAPFPYAGEAAALSCSLLWAVGGVLFARIRSGVTAGAMNFGKNTTGALCFAVLFLVTTGAVWPSGVGAGGLWALVASGFIGLTLCDTFFLRALLEIGPQRATLFMASAPVLVALVALLPPFGETPSALAWAGMVVCLGGVALAALRRPPPPVPGETRSRGVRDGLLAAVFQACGLLFARYALTHEGVAPDAGAYLRLSAGAVGLLLVGGATGRAGRWVRSLRRERVWLRLGFAAFLGTFLGIWANMAAIGWSSHTGVAATLSSLAPVFLIPLSAAFLGERFDARAWVSTLLAIAGIALMTI